MPLQGEKEEGENAVCARGRVCVREGVCARVRVLLCVGILRMLTLSLSLSFSRLLSLFPSSPLIAQVGGAAAPPVQVQLEVVRTSLRICQLGGGDVPAIEAPDGNGFRLQCLCLSGWIQAVDELRYDDGDYVGNERRLFHGGVQENAVVRRHVHPHHPRRAPSPRPLPTRHCPRRGYQDDPRPFGGTFIIINIGLYIVLLPSSFTGYQESTFSLNLDKALILVLNGCFNLYFLCVLEYTLVAEF